MKPNDDSEYRAASYIESVLEEKAEAVGRMIVDQRVRQLRYDCDPTNHPTRAVWVHAQVGIESLVHPTTGERLIAKFLNAASLDAGWSLAGATNEYLILRTKVGGR